MKRLLSAVAVLAVLPLAAVPLSAAPLDAVSSPLQGPPAPVEGPGGPGMHGGFGPGFGPRQPVTNAPYSAMITSTSTDKLQDGTVLTHTGTRLVSRDSLGRTREEVTFTPHRGPDADKPVTTVTIFDPVSHTITRLDPAKKIAFVHQLPQPRDGEHRHGPREDQPEGARPHRENPNVQVTDLGSKTVAGVVATGKRITHTVPAGQIGNTAPIVSTREEWFSPDLKIELSSNDVDPFHGTHITTVSGLTKAEPDAKLFQVPGDYTVQQPRERAGRGHRGPGGDAPLPPPGV